MRELRRRRRATSWSGGGDDGAWTPGEVYAKDHRIHHTGTGKSFDFGEVVDVAADIGLPAGDAKLEAQGQVAVEVHRQGHAGGRQLRHEHRRRQLRRGHLLPGMKIAVIGARAGLSGKVKSFDATEALKVQGVEQVVEIPALPTTSRRSSAALGGVAVLGTNTWSVLKGRGKLTIEWDDGPNAAHDSSTYDQTGAARRRPARAATSSGKRGDVDAAFAADKVRRGRVLRAVLHPHPDGAAGRRSSTQRGRFRSGPDPVAERHAAAVAEALGRDQ